MIKNTSYCCGCDVCIGCEKYNQLIKIMVDKENERKIREAKKIRKSLEFQYKNLMAVLPENVDEIIREGKILDHCVGSYAERHANNKLTILFIRNTEKPDVPYYTIEVSNEGRIVQCRGFRNNLTCRGGSEKTKDIIEFEKAYQEYLDEIFTNKHSEFNCA